MHKISSIWIICSSNTRNMRDNFQSAGDILTKGLVYREIVVPYQWEIETQQFGIKQVDNGFKFPLYEDYKVDVPSIGPSVFTLIKNVWNISLKYLYGSNLSSHLIPNFCCSYGHQSLLTPETRWKIDSYYNNYYSYWPVKEFFSFVVLKLEMKFKLKQ